MNDRLLSLLGIARKAGKLTYGFDSVCDSVRKRESRVILVSNDISEGTLSKLKNHIDETELLEIPYDIDRIDAAIGKAVRIVSVNDKGFAQKVKQLICTGNGEESLHDN